MTTINFNYRTLDEMVFEQKNKNYGAYVIRKKHDRILSIAFGSSVAFFLLMFFLPQIIDALRKDKVEVIVPPTKISFVDMTQPPTLEEPPPPPDVKLPTPPAQAFVPPKVLADELVQNEDTIATQKELQQANISNVTQKVEVDFSSSGELTQVTEAPKKQEPFIVVEQMPYFIDGGEEGLISWIQSHAKYPQIAKENDIEGKVFVQFTVAPSGKVIDVVIAKSVDKLLDAEALRVISALPDFKPGRQSGNAVPVRMILPVDFQLN